MVSDFLVIKKYEVFSISMEILNPRSKQSINIVMYIKQVKSTFYNVPEYPNEITFHKKDDQ